MRLLGLAGNAGAGKDHVYETLKRDLEPWVVERVAFADSLKFDIEETLGVLPHDLPAIRTKPYTPEVRMLLQWWGTELRREHYGDDYWVKKGMEMVREVDTWADLIIVTDVRFANEAEIIRANGGIVAEVYATRETRQRRLGGGLPPAHASEVIDFLTDAMIDNETTPILPKFVNEHLGLPYDFVVTSG